MSVKKKALLITYYWPPSGGSAVFRWLAFTKYLSEFGWEVSVYTPENPVPAVIDDELLKEVSHETVMYKTKIKEPGNLFGLKSTKGKQVTQSNHFIRGEKKFSLLQSVMIWVRGNFFIPDARMLWIRPSVRHLKKLLKEEHFDAVISTGPPHSMHMIALGLKQKFGIKWLADFRDPWTNIDFYTDLKLTKWGDSRHHKMEKLVVKHADAIVTVGPTMTKEFKDMGSQNVVTVTNGYDTKLVDSPEINLDSKFSILHLGSMNPSRNPKQLWPILKELCQEIKGFQTDLKIHLVGGVDHSILDSIKANGLSEQVFQEGHIPNSIALRYQQQAQVLLLVINNTANAKGILTNKFFEYMLAKRPILAVGPVDGDAAAILRETNSGTIFHYLDKDSLKQEVLSLYKQYKIGTLGVDSKGIEKYSRKELAKEINQILNRL